MEGGDLKDIERAKSFVEDALAIQAEEAKEAGALGYFARLLVQVTMPHSKPTDSFFERRNGSLTLTMMAPPKVGLPYGTYPRLLMAWITTEAVRTGSRELELGASLSDFLRRLDVGVHGGPRGSISILRRQMTKLFSSSIHWCWDRATQSALGVVAPVERANLWWDPKRPDQVAMWKSSIFLNETFFREVTDRPVPVNMTALKVLARERSPMALDIYSWLTYRMSYLRKTQLVPWELLQLQFGSDYTRTRAFKEKFLERLRLVMQVYPQAKLSPDPEGLILSPSPSHIPFQAIQGDHPFPMPRIRRPRQPEPKGYGPPPPGMEELFK